MKEAETTKIDGVTYRFTEFALKIPVYAYLLIGKGRALLTDAGLFDKKAKKVES